MMLPPFPFPLPLFLPKAAGGVGEGATPKSQPGSLTRGAGVA